MQIQTQSQTLSQLVAQTQIQTQTLALVRAKQGPSFVTDLSKSRGLHEQRYPVHVTAVHIVGDVSCRQKVGSDIALRCPNRRVARRSALDVFQVLYGSGMWSQRLRSSGEIF